MLPTHTGTVSLLLQRAVEWLTRADLRDRVGDAGPFFYVPDARGERTVRHEVAVACVPCAGDAMALQQLNAAYQAPPLVVRAEGSGSETSWRLLQENAPLSCLQVVEGNVLARFANPTASGAAAVYRVCNRRMSGARPAAQSQDWRPRPS